MPIANYSDLKITLSRWKTASSQGETATYQVELRFSQPDDEAERSPERGSARFKFDELRDLARKPAEYGRALKESLFADPNLHTFFEKALAVSQDAGQTLRLRLLIDRSARELHGLRWETLRSLADDGFLAMDQNLLFSRYLHSYDWSRVQLRAKSELRALVIAANPLDLAQGGHFVGSYTLAEVDVDGELQRARAALAGIHTVDELGSDPDEPGQVTLDKLLEHLRRGYDILYLACHGGLLPQDLEDAESPLEPYLWLEKADGSADVVRGESLVQRLKNLYASLRPKLVVLASCQSAGQGGQPAKTADPQGALAALGPRLAQAGIPAVLAMQGDVLMDTVAAFMPIFFQQVAAHGQLDRAMAVAREGVAGQRDWWMPVLFLRLRGGQLWHVSTFAGDQSEFESWKGIVTSIKTGKCTPILGSGLLEPLIGSSPEIARRWAEASHFPLSPHSQDDLPQVAQYLAASQGLAYPADTLLEHVKTELLERYGSEFPPDAEHLELEDLAALLGAQRRAEDPADPYNVLARLPFSIYINANPDNLLFEALRAQDDKDPRVEFARWKTDLEALPSIYDNDNQPPYKPTIQKPLVYHLFGTIQEPDSLVLTEDDYFDFLMWVNRYNNVKPIPSEVMAAWSANALLFLGFQMSDWDFRVLFRSILNEERRYRSRRYRSVAVQIQPGEGHLQPERARRHLEKLFLGAQISAYWGNAEDFIEDLWQHWQEEGGGAQ